MKKVCFLTVIGILLMVGSAFAFEQEFLMLQNGPEEVLFALALQGIPPPPPAVDEDGKIERFHKFRLMKLSEMAEEVGIDDKTVLKMSEILKKYDKQRFELFSEGKRLRIELKRLMEDKSAKKEDINKAIDAFLENRSKIQTLKTEEIKEIRKIITPEQQAKMILYMAERFEKRMKKMKNFGPKHGVAPSGGPGMVPSIGNWFFDDTE